MLIHINNVSIQHNFCVKKILTQILGGLPYIISHCVDHIHLCDKDLFNVQVWFIFDFSLDGKFLTFLWMISIDFEVQIYFSCWFIFHWFFIFNNEEGLGGYGHYKECNIKYL